MSVTSSIAWIAALIGAANASSTNPYSSTRYCEAVLLPLRAAPVTPISLKVLEPKFVKPDVENTPVTFAESGRLPLLAPAIQELLQSSSNLPPQNPYLVVDLKEGCRTALPDNLSLSSSFSFFNRWRQFLAWCKILHRPRIFLSQNLHNLFCDFTRRLQSLHPSILQKTC